MLHSAAPYRRDESASLRVPVVMPLVEVSVDDHGRADVRLDGAPYSTHGALQRSDLPLVLSEVAADLGTPVRVEIHEPGGTVFTDIVTPGSEAPAPPKAVERRTTMHSASGIAGEGFVAGEEVAVAIVVAHQVANEDGTAHLRLPPALLADHPGVVLFGRSSGAIAVCDGVG